MTLRLWNRKRTREPSDEAQREVNHFDNSRGLTPPDVVDSTHSQGGSTPRVPGFAKVASAERNPTLRERLSGAGASRRIAIHAAWQEAIQSRADGFVANSIFRVGREQR
jgi:hypothetical protein